jgi:hypothetical protein
MGDDGWFKSSFSDGNTCVETLFHKATASHENACVEVGMEADHVHVRNSRDRTGPVLTFTRAEWEAFSAGVRADEFNF